MSILLKDQIINDIKTNNIILYMKGSKLMPMCGFSATVVKILGMYDIDYKDVNVLEDPDIRINLSEHSNWPTIPQLFVKGELIGGCDILVELHNTKQLEKILS
jgi:monothiol glutaredoxin